MLEWLMTKDKGFEKLEVKIVASRRDLEKANNQLMLKFGKSIEILDQIIGSESSPHIKTDISLTKDQKGKLVEQSMKSVENKLDEKSSQNSRS